MDHQTEKTDSKTFDPKDGALPVSGYKPQSGSNVTIVNSFKALEERVLRRMEEVQFNAPRGSIDLRWFAIGRTQLEQAFMAINRGVFQPGRVKLPGDDGYAETDLG